MYKLGTSLGRLSYKRLEKQVFSLGVVQKPDGWRKAGGGSGGGEAAALAGGGARVSRVGDRHGAWFVQGNVR